MSWRRRVYAVVVHLLGTAACMVVCGALAIWFHTTIETIASAPWAALAVTLVALSYTVIVTWVLREGAALLVLGGIVFTVVALALFTLVEVGVPRLIVAWAAAVIAGGLVGVLGWAVLRAGSFRALLEQLNDDP